MSCRGHRLASVALIGLAVIGAAAAEAEAGQRTVGPIVGGQGPKSVSFYIRARADGATKANIHVAPSNPNNREAVFVVRVLGPDENIVYWQAYHRAPGASAVPDIYREGIGGVPSARGDTDDTLPDLALALTDSGVHQIQVFSSSDTTVKLDLWDDDGYGIAMQPGTHHHWPGQPASMWVRAVPHPTSAMYVELFVSSMVGDDPDLDILNIVSAAAGEIFRAEGYEYDPIHAPGRYRGVIITDNAELAAGAAPDDWEVFFPRAPFRFTVKGFPIVLCEDQATAQAIGNSIRTVPADAEFAYQGALIDHKFQEMIADLMPELVAGAGNARTLYELAEDYPYSGGTNVACYSPVDDNDVVRHYDILYHSSALVSSRWALGAEDAGDPDPTWANPNQQLDVGSDWLASVGLHHFERQKCPSGRDRECTAPGATCQGSECSPAFDEAADRWDVMRRVQFKGDTHGVNGFDGLYAGNTLNYLSLPVNMAFVASQASACNPYSDYKEELYRRAAALVLFDLMSLLQGYTYPDIDYTTYSGFGAFRARRHFATFARIQPDLEGLMSEMACDGDSRPLRECVREAWTYGMRALFDRWWISKMETARNQTAHFPYAFLCFVRGIDDGHHDAIFETYKDMAFNYADRFQDSANEAGWFSENSGPSPSYEGITHWFMGMALQDMEALNALHTDDEYEETVALEFRDALVRSYRFHNYFAAKEPGSAVTFAAHNQSHRIGDGLNYEQFNGAQGIVEDEAAIAVWADVRFDVDIFGDELLTAAQAFDAYCENGFPASYPAALYQYFDLYARETSELELPHETMTPGSVIKVPADGSQMTAIRRGAYYACFYTGQPASSPVYTADFDREVKAAPYAWSDGSVTHTEDDPDGNNLRSASYTKPMTGGGLSLLWTEEFGTGLIATNWSPLQHHGIVLEKNDPDGDDRYWEDYHAPLTVQDLSAGGVDIFEMNGALESRFSGAGGYTRRYEFHDDKIVVTVTIDTSAKWINFHLDRAWENIPLPTTDSTPECSDCGPWQKENGSTIVDASGCALTEGEHTLDEFAVIDSNNNGIRVVITQRPSGADPTIIVRPYGLRRQFYNDPDLQIGRVEIPFDDDDYNGLQVLEYEIHPVQLSGCLEP